MRSLRLIHVVPIARSGMRELTYYTASAVEPGELVRVPVRSRLTPALVVRTQPVADAKARVRRAGYQTRRITAAGRGRAFTGAFMRAAHKTAHEHATTIGAVLHALVPAAVLEDLTTAAPKENSGSAAHGHAPTTNERLVLQAPRDERFETYRTLAREALARGESMYICVPTNQYALALGDWLAKGISEYVHILSSTETKKRQRAAWAAAAQEDHAVIIIGTPSFVSIPRRDIATYIIEQEQSRFYKNTERPLIDLRRAIEFIAQTTHARCIFADFPARIETLYRRELGELEVLDVSATAEPTGAPVRIIDTRRGEGEPFAALHADTFAEIERAGARGEHTFIYAARRGIAPTIVCQDCGTPVRCVDCGASVALHAGRNDEYNELVCHACGARRSAAERCGTCRSWRLIELGVGIERIADELAAVFPDAPVFILDSDTIKTHAQARDIMKRFTSTPGAILVGTERAMAYLPARVGCVVLSSYDALLSIPDIRVSERAMALVLRLRAHADSAFLIQTRMPDAAALRVFATNRLIDFYRDERSIRKALCHPPFRVLVKIAHPTGSGSAGCAPAMRRLRETFPAYPLHQFETYRGRRKFSIELFSVPREDWPDEALLAALAALPPSCAVDVHPESILS